MARYDRIAPLTSPERDRAFPAWPVLRDIEGQDRDTDVCRRARLRFLALRPVRRLADSKPGSVSAESFDRQLEVVRDELRVLSAHDADHVRITRFLRNVEDRDPGRIVQALLEFAEQTHTAGHRYAAHEYATTANTLRPGAGAELIARFRTSEPDVEEEPGATLERSWNELRQADAPAQRAVILERIGRALLSLNLLTAAERCLAMITQRQADMAVRSRARAAHALVAALDQQPDVYRDRRDALIKDGVEWSADPRVAAGVHIDLGHACVAAGDLDFAREHVRAAITIARRHNYAEMLRRAENILAALEQNTEVLLQPRTVSSETAQRIAAQIELLELPTPAT